MAAESIIQPKSATYLSKGGVFSGQQTFTFDVPSSTNAKVILSVNLISGNGDVGFLWYNYGCYTQRNKK